MVCEFIRYYDFTETLKEDYKQNKSSGRWDTCTR